MGPGKTIHWRVVGIDLAFGLMEGSGRIQNQPGMEIGTAVTSSNQAPKATRDYPPRRIRHHQSGVRPAHPKEPVRRNFRKPWNLSKPLFILPDWNFVNEKGQGLMDLAPFFIALFPQAFR